MVVEHAFWPIQTCKNVWNYREEEIHKQAHKPIHVCRSWRDVMCSLRTIGCSVRATNQEGLRISSLTAKVKYQNSHCWDGAEHEV